MQRHADSPYVQRASWPKVHPDARTRVVSNSATRPHGVVCCTSVGAQVLNTSSDVIVIMLGTNDAKDTSDGGPANWENNGVTGQVEYIADYAWMVAQFNALPSHPDIFVTIPVPNYKPGVYGMNHTVINYIFPVIVPQIAAADTPKHAPLDMFDCMGGVKLTHPELFADGCHVSARARADARVSYAWRVGPQAIACVRVCTVIILCVRACACGGVHGVCSAYESAKVNCACMGVCVCASVHPRNCAHARVRMFEPGIGT